MTLHCVSTALRVSLHLLGNMWIVDSCQLLAAVGEAAVVGSVQTPVQVPAVKSFGNTPRTGIAGPYGNSVVKFLGNCHSIFIVAALFLRSPQQFLHSSPALIVFRLLGGNHPNGCKMVLISLFQ